MNYQKFRIIILQLGSMLFWTQSHIRPKEVSVNAVWQHLQCNSQLNADFDRVSICYWGLQDQNLELNAYYDRVGVIFQHLQHPYSGCMTKQKHVNVICCLN